MNLASVMDELGYALDAIPDLNVFPFSVDRITPPAVIVGYPDKIDFDATFGRGSDKIDLPLFLMVGRLDQRSARDAMAQYLDGSGPYSVKQAIDGYEYTALDSVRLASAEVQSMSSAGVDYLGAILQLQITGRGAA